MTEDLETIVPFHGEDAAVEKVADFSPGGGFRVLFQYYIDFS